MEQNNNTNNVNQVTSNQEQSRRNVSEQWIHSIYEKLKDLEMYELTSKEGFPGLNEYISQMPQLSNNPNLLPQIYLKNLGLYISEMEILLPNIRKIYPEDSYKKISNNLEIVRRVYDGKSEKIQLTEQVFSQQSRITIITLTDNFKLILDMLSTIRKAVVFELSSILFALGSKDKRPMER